MSKAFPKIWVVVILIIFVAGGFLAWQYFNNLAEKAEKEGLYIEVLTPNGGEEWMIGNSYEIQWKAMGLEEENVKLSLALPGHGWEVVDIIAASSEKYSWRVPLDISSGEYKISITWPAEVRMSKVKIGDDSDDYFNIVKSGTADWNTYRNEDYEFEVKYPRRFSVKEFPQNTISDLGILPWLIAVKFAEEKNGQPLAKIFVRNFDRVSEARCRDLGGEFNGSIEIMNEERLKCLRPEFGASTVSEYSVLIGQRDNIFFDFDCGDLSEEQLCNQMLSTFRFIEPEGIIQTGSVKPLSGSDLQIIQDSVDEDHFAWRLNPLLVAQAEGRRYGFESTDKFSLISEGFGEYAGTYIAEVEAKHGDQTYIIQLIQPMKIGEGGIWIINSISAQ